MEIMNTHTLEMINSDELVINKDYNIEHFFAILSLRLFSNIYIGNNIIDNIIDTTRSSQ
jgi:hypothetical protein